MEITAHFLTLGDEVVEDVEADVEPDDDDADEVALTWI